MNGPYSHKKRFLFIPLAIGAFIFVAGYAVMFLWNAILPEVITSVGKLNYTQALGLLVLCRILFGGFKGKGNCGHGSTWNGGGWGWRDKMKGMTEEEREKFKAEWRERCGRK